MPSPLTAVILVAATLTLAVTARGAIADPVAVEGDSTHTDTPVISPSGAAAPLEPMPAPTAGASEDERSPKYPAIHLSGGVGYFASSNGIGDAFHRIEGVHRAAGYSIRRAPGLESFAIALSTLTVQIAPPVAVAIQLGRTESQSNDVRLTGGLLSGRLATTSSPRLTLVGGFGGGICGFKFIRYYGDVISPQGASYTTLSHITLEGRGRYWTANGGLDFGVSPHLAFEGRIQYVVMPDVTVDAGRAGTAAINLSGGLAGVALAYKF